MNGLWNGWMDGQTGGSAGDLSFNRGGTRCGNRGSTQPRPVGPGCRRDSAGLSWVGLVADQLPCILRGGVANNVKTAIIAEDFEIAMIG